MVRLVRTDGGLVFSLISVFYSPFSTFTLLCSCAERTDEEVLRELQTKKNRRQKHKLWLHLSAHGEKKTADHEACS